MNKLEYLFFCLKENEIDELKIKFNGSGDDGAMHFESVKSNNKNKIEEVLNYYEVTPNSFLDEPTPYVEEDANGLYNISKKLTLADILWHAVYTCLEQKKINWCEGRGNKGSIAFDVLKGRINLDYLKFSRGESYIEIKNPAVVYDKK